jgi:hypothetical protein
MHWKIFALLQNTEHDALHEKGENRLKLIPAYFMSECGINCIIAQYMIVVNHIMVAGPL